MDIICSSPLHSTRSSEPDFQDVIGEGDVENLGMLCAACSRLDVFESLEAMKQAKIRQIDDHTDALIAAGFTFAGKQFSLSLFSQNKIIGTHQIKDDAALVYPIRWNTLDDEDAIEVVDATMLDGFYKTALGTLRARLDSGTTLKDQVRAATTIADVVGVVDDR
jgi:hypothetical protein